MNVCITTAYPAQDGPISFLRDYMRQDRFGIHHATEDPDEADLILFVEHPHYYDDPFLRGLRAHPWVRKYREKCFLYDEHDHPWHVLPGIYFSMPARYYRPAMHRAYRYLRTINPYIGDTAVAIDAPDIACSFTGARNAPVRHAIFSLEGQGVHLEDTSKFDAYAGLRPNHEEQWRTYAESMARSRFVLCPRGRATSSPRLFETMEAGRVPILLADGYVLPEGPRWEDFLIVLPEAEVARIPDVVREHDPRWCEMGQNARAAWEEWFAPDVIFHRMVELCRDIQETRAVSTGAELRPSVRPLVRWAARHYAHKVLDPLR